MVKLFADLITLIAIVLIKSYIIIGTQSGFKPREFCQHPLVEEKICVVVFSGVKRNGSFYCYVNKLLKTFVQDYFTRRTRIFNVKRRY